MRSYPDGRARSRRNAPRRTCSWRACCRKDRDLDAALEHARIAIGDAPRDPLAHYAMAELREAAGDD